MSEAAAPSPDSVRAQSSELADRLQRVLHQLWMRHREWEATYAAAGMLTAQQLDFLSILIAHGPTRASDLADLIGVAASSISIGAQRLIRNGLIIRSSRSSDLREVYIDITERGQSRYQLSLAARINESLDALGQLSPRDREALRRALPILHQIAQGIAAGPDPQAHPHSSAQRGLIFPLCFLNSG